MLQDREQADPLWSDHYRATRPRTTKLVHYDPTTTVRQDWSIMIRPLPCYKTENNKANPLCSDYYRYFDPL
jgi:hypothetical protein